MRKIQQAAGKRKSHAEIGKIKDKYEKESVKEFIKLFQKTAIKKAIVIAKKMKGNMTGAVKKIEKMNRGLSDQPQVAAALRKANESVNEMPNFDRGTSGLPKGFTDDTYKTLGKKI
jgi:N-methylhydantoinase B/oxoprolinase/acetone carboxylase alpha subunit